MTAEAVFIFNLLQDVNILRPLVFLARDLGLEPRLLVSSAFADRDTTGLWRNELDAIALSAPATKSAFANAAEAADALRAGGIVFAGSESNLDAHNFSHDALRVAPASYVTATLQHGFECVGFLHSRAHDTAYGREVTFAADVVCGWTPLDLMASLAPSQRDKLLVTGPTALLQQPAPGPKLDDGIVCENLHSVRFRGKGDPKGDFVSAFDAFCKAKAAEQQSVVLRPHPGGQYTIREKVRVQPNVRINNNPMYRVDLAKYAYGISSPSSILLDMMLAGIPTAVWSDDGGSVDTSHYAGLTFVSTLDDWIGFSRDARDDPAPYIARQEAFLDAWRIQRDPERARQAFADLMLGAARRVGGARSPAREVTRPRRVLVVANGDIPTVKISFDEPLAADRASGAMVLGHLTENAMRKQVRSKASLPQSEAWWLARLAEFSPDVVIFCRYSGPNADAMLRWCRANAIPTIFHIDDDLLAVPTELGEQKFRMHNDPARLGTIRTLTADADLLYCVNPVMLERLAPLRGAKPSYLGQIANSGDPVKDPPSGRTQRIGYMGIAHAHDLAPLVPVIAKLLDQRPELEFHFFGTTPKPPEWARFGERIVETPFVVDYASFRSTFATLDWGIGIAPLLRIPFNLGKTNLKWVDYTAVGVATVASRGTLYDACCADGCGLLAETPEEWLAALEFLLDHPEERIAMVRRAQERARREYSRERLRQQVLEALDAADAALAARAREGRQS